MTTRELPNLGTAQLMTLRDVCLFTRMSARTIYRRLERGEFPRPKRFSSRLLRWTRGSVEKWVMRQSEIE